MEINELMSLPLFSMPQSEKDILYDKIFPELIDYHKKACPQYARIISLLDDSNNIPFIPVRLFKEFELLSVPKEDIIKVMTSSGTTGQSVSKIYLDKETSKNQSSVLVKIVSDFIGTKRLPMLIVDSPDVIKNRNMFSARGAGILGFSMFGHHQTYALLENMDLDYEGVFNFIQKYKQETILLFGFTSIVWQHFCKSLLESDKKLELKNAILIHGGGWKKLQSQALDNNAFKSSLNEVCGLKRVFNYYGMVEQTGSIFIECEYGNLHCSIYSDIIIRNFIDFSIVPNGEKGLIQLLSLLPKSYPGHSILTEDIGVITGVDECACGRLGKTFSILGRIAKAEIRGCSDTYEG